MGNRSGHFASMKETSTSVFGVLGALVGTATVISLVKSGFSIELFGLPAKVFHQYAWLRDMLFEPVVWASRYWGLILPWWLKDLIVAYGVVAGAFWRAAVSAREALDISRLAVMIWPWTAVMLYIVSGVTSSYPRIFFVFKEVRRQLAIIVIAAIAFFLWNYIQNAFGPPA